MTVDDEIVWINGTFGAGKTTTSTLLAERLPARLFDSETVGTLLRHLLADTPVVDFQEYRAWRRLVPHTAAALLAETGGRLVIPQTVLVERYWKDLLAGFEDLGLRVRPFVLHTDRERLTRRINDDAVETGAREWRLRRLDDYERAAAAWLHASATTIDTSLRSPEEVAATILAELE